MSSHKAFVTSLIIIPQSSIALMISFLLEFHPLSHTFFLTCSLTPGSLLARFRLANYKFRLKKYESKSFLIFSNKNYRTGNFKKILHQFCRALWRKKNEIRCFLYFSDSGHVILKICKPIVYKWDSQGERRKKTRGKLFPVRNESWIFHVRQRSSFFLTSKWKIDREFFFTPEFLTNDLCRRRAGDSFTQSMFHSLYRVLRSSVQCHRYIPLSIDPASISICYRKNYIMLQIPLVKKKTSQIGYVRLIHSRRVPGRCYAWIRDFYKSRVVTERLDRSKLKILRKFNFLVHFVGFIYLIFLFSKTFPENRSRGLKTNSGKLTMCLAKITSFSFFVCFGKFDGIEKLNQFSKEIECESSVAFLIVQKSPPTFCLPTQAFSYQTRNLFGALLIFLRWNEPNVLRVSPAQHGREKERENDEPAVERTFLMIYGSSEMFWAAIRFRSTTSSVNRWLCGFSHPKRSYLLIAIINPLHLYFRGANHLKHIFNSVAMFLHLFYFIVAIK